MFRHADPARHQPLRLPHIRMQACIWKTGIDMVCFFAKGHDDENHGAPGIVQDRLWRIEYFPHFRYLCSVAHSVAVFETAQSTIYGLKAHLHWISYRLFAFVESIESCLRAFH